MALIDLQNITKQYDIKIILKNINFSLQEHQRVAIIGQNGQGKSTLMKIISRDINPDSGEMAIDKRLKIEMLDQQPKFKPGINVRDSIESQLIELKSAKDRYDKISKQLETDYENKYLMKEASDIGTYLDHHSAWDLEDKVQRVLMEFNLKHYEFKDIALLSGGEQRRVSLAGLILKKPDVLLLDEPTNHLDVYMVEFLEELLTKEKFTLLFISHDRYFIDNIATNVIEIEDGNLRKFNGGYSKYLEQKEKLLQDMQKNHENLVRELRAEAYWMQHGVSARRKRNVLRKDNYFELKEKVKSNPARIRKMSLELQREAKSFNDGDIVNKKKMLFELDNIYLNLGKKNLIQDFTTRILQKDTIAIVGPNGSGKSTILKIFLERIKVNKGTFKKGDFKIGYFDQNRELLDDNKTIMHTFCPNGGDRVILDDGRNLHVYGYLKNFLFPKEYLDKKIGVLSGGEKNRIALALLFTRDVDCLIMDEPTNDLDIPTINILEEYLKSFQGALIFVSHDRYFVDKIAKKLFIFKGDGIIEESFIPYSEYLNCQKDINDLNYLEKQINKKKIVNKNTNNKNTKTIVKLSYNDKKEYDNLPNDIEELEYRIKELEKCMMNQTCYEEQGLIKLHEELSSLNSIYEKKVERFLELEEFIENIKN
ncbi:COG0488: ATPase components of ABC transporters with duplicated ATPase domains [hydrothermal vent metagenome]|uniref:COG0488: ATPase components of ABC transporters with duplicated ATPase domains n=1 Tax=hydrothermal vent metagenome TaxID=652676 RepID=A0A3B1E5N1_9ZZZZ